MEQWQDHRIVEAFLKDEAVRILIVLNLAIFSTESRRDLDKVRFLAHV